MKQCGKPEHIAIIPDGNRRWAVQHGFPVRKGHEEGAKKIIEILKYCQQLNIPYVTLYAFSSENLERPAKETQFFFSILTDYLNRMADEFLEKGVHIIFIGDIASLPASIQKSVRDCQEKSKKNSHKKVITVQVALGYGGRNEIVRAVKKINQAITQKEITIDQIDTSLISKHLDTANVPDPDLLIRSGGDHRISNFLLFQMAYTEFFFTPVFWPDFSKEELDKALADFSKRERRFGKRTLEDQANSEGRSDSGGQANSKGRSDSGGQDNSKRQNNLEQQFDAEKKIDARRKLNSEEKLNSEGQLKSEKKLNDGRKSNSEKQLDAGQKFDAGRKLDARRKSNSERPLDAGQKIDAGRKLNSEGKLGSEKSNSERPLDARRKSASSEKKSPSPTPKKHPEKQPNSITAK